MRRYAIRFLVAALTFSIGVALTLAFGLFPPRFITKFEVWEYGGSSTCRGKSFRVARPAFLTVDNHMGDPLRLVYLGTTPDVSSGDEVRMRLLVENKSDKVVSGYWITASEIWETKGAKGVDWTAFEILEPGQSSTFSLPRKAEAASLRVAKVNFRDGSTWINPRMTR